MEQYDIVVAGAGIAGSIAAAMAAKHGAKVVLLDRNVREEVGKKTNWGWVCGDAVAKTHIDFLHSNLGISLSDREIATKVDGVYAFSPDMKNKFLFEGEGYSLDRPNFARRLLEQAVKNGAEYRPGHEVEGPILEGEKVVGVFGRDEKKEPFKIGAKLVIDALGIASTLRRKLPPNEFIEKDVAIEDIESTGRYIMEIETEGEDTNYYDSKNAIIHLNQELAPGGYGWVFPKRGKQINIGLGVEKNSLEIRNKKMGKKDTLHSLIDEYVKWNKVIKDYKILDTDKNGKGYWSVTVRRQMPSLVYNGYMGAGDSMAMPNPLSAGGIGPAITAGVLAGKVAAEAIAEGNTSMEHIWKYNLEFNERYGNKTAGLEVFRIYLQSLNNDLINYGFSHFLTPQEAEQISYGLIPELSVKSVFNKIVGGIANVNAFRNMLFAVDKMKRLNALYAKYPKSVADFNPWKEAVNREMAEVKERFKPNPV